MAYKCSFAFLLVLSLLANALCVPPNFAFRRRRDSNDNDIDTSEDKIAENKDKASYPLLTGTKPSAANDDNDDDDDFNDDNFQLSTTSSGGGGGSDIFSLINLASAFLPSLSGSNNAQNADGTTSSSGWPFLTLQMDVIRALVQFGTSIIGLASSGSSGGSPPT